MKIRARQHHEGKTLWLTLIEPDVDHRTVRIETHDPEFKPFMSSLTMKEEQDLAQGWTIMMELGLKQQALIGDSLRNPR